VLRNILLFNQVSQIETYFLPTPAGQAAAILKFECAAAMTAGRRQVI
jgi:hypothetical protein